MNHKKFFILIIAITLIFSQAAFPFTVSAGFSDVERGSVYYTAVNYLSKKGIISGYDDGTFRPNGHITRAEAATIIVRAGGFSLSSTKSTYSDVDNSHWGRKYIMTATKNKIMSGMGGKLFSPDADVTYNQIVKMVVCLAGLENKAVKEGGWPDGYIEVAKSYGIIDNSVYKSIKAYGEEPARRGEVAVFIYNTLTLSSSSDKNTDTDDEDSSSKASGKVDSTPKDNGSSTSKDSGKTEESELNTDFTVAGKSYALGMKESSLPAPDEKLTSTSGFTWYVYGTKTYKDFFAAGISDGKVVVLASSGTGFSYKGYSFGSDGENAPGVLYTDKNAGGTVHGILLSEKYLRCTNVSADAFYGESRMNFHATNAFRVAYGKSILLWDSKAEKAAYLHSKDMADKNYFSHDSLDGTKFYERLKAQGVSYRSCAENIAAGHSSGFEAYNGWVNSGGHRENMLSNQKYLGVGAAQNAGSTYKYYFTQDFYTK